MKQRIYKGPGNGIILQWIHRCLYHPEGETRDEQGSSVGTHVFVGDDYYHDYWGTGAFFREEVQMFPKGSLNSLSFEDRCLSSIRSRITFEALSWSRIGEQPRG